MKYHEPQNFTGGVLAQAETRLQLLDYKRTAAAYEQAMAAAPSIDLLQNLAAAYVNDGKPQSAIDAVKAAGQHLPSSQEELATMGYGETEISLLLWARVCSMARP